MKDFFKKKIKDIKNQFKDMKIEREIFLNKFESLEKHIKDLKIIITENSREILEDKNSVILQKEKMDNLEFQLSENKTLIAELTENINLKNAQEHPIQNLKNKLSEIKTSNYLLQKKPCLKISVSDFLCHSTTQVIDSGDSVIMSQISTNDVLCRFKIPFSIAKFKIEILSTRPADRWIGIFLITPDFQTNDPHGVNFSKDQNCICYNGILHCKKMTGRYKDRKDTAIDVGTVFTVTVDTKQRVARISTQDKQIDLFTHQVNENQQFILALRLCFLEMKVKVTRIY